MPGADRHWLDLIVRVDRTGHATRAYCRFFGRIFVRLTRIGKRLAKRLAKGVGRIARACCRWILVVLFTLVMDVVMTLDLFLAYPVRGLRHLRAALRHSTDWHDAKIDGRWMEARRMPGSDCLEIRRKERP